MNTIAQSTENSIVTLKDLLADEESRRMYENIKKLKIRSSIYDVTNKCNLRCTGCFFFSSEQDKVARDEKDISLWEDFVVQEKERGVNNAILIGGEPTLYLDRVEAFYKHMPTFCATNGLIKVPRDRFPDMMVGISLWGNDEHEEKLRGQKTFSTSLNHYKNDLYVYYLYTITPNNLHMIEEVTIKIRDAGLKIHYQLYSNDESENGFDWSFEEKKEVKDKMDEMLDKYPDTVISSKYYHQILIDNKLLGRDWGWEECPSVSLDCDDRDPQPKRLIGFQSYASDLKTIHRCCTSDTRDCKTCNDGAAKMSWVMVNKREHMQNPNDFKNWMEVTEMFAKLYQYIPW
ncbi:MAG: radical SAM protein [Spirochaetota bacterium]|nr:radical SAM protein [Spirochaetota bacterium]